MALVQSHGSVITSLHCCSEKIGTQTSDNNRRVYRGGPTRRPAAFVPAVFNPQERRGRGDDQVEYALLRGASIPVRFFSTQSTLQLRANGRGT